MKSVQNGVVVIVALLALLCGRAWAQVMGQVPQSALMVVKVNNLKAVNEKVGRLAQGLGVAAMLPPAADPLAFLQVQLQLQQGLDVNGELAFVMLDPTTVTGAGGPEDSIVILVPVTDFKAFMSNFADAKTDGGVAEVRIAGELSYVAEWGKYAAIAPGKTVLASKPTGGLTAPAASSKELAGKDIILYANMAAIRTKALPQLQEARPMAIQSVEQMFAQQPNMVKFTAAVKAGMGQLLNAMETYLKESDGATVGLALVPEGLNITVMNEFTPGSYLGNTFTAYKGTDGPLMTGLPTGKYLLFGGAVSDPAVSGKLLGDIVDPIVTELLAVGPEWAVAKDYVDALKQAMKATKAQSFGMIAPTGAVGTESLIQVVSVQTGDTAAMKDANLKMLASQDKLMKALAVPGTEGMLPKHTPNAKTVDGVMMDSLVTKLDMDPQNPAAMQQAQMMNIMYGPQGAVVHTGAVGDKMVIFMGTKDDVMSSTITAVKAGGSPLDVDTNVKAVSMQLPKQRLAVVYFNAGEFATTALSYARQFGLAMPVMLPPDLPPVGVAMSADGTALRIDAHVPTDLVRSFIAAGMQAQMQMQGGPPPGGGL